MEGALPAAGAVLEGDKLALLASPGDIFDVHGEEDGAGITWHESEHAVLRQAWVGCDGHEELIEPVAGPTVLLDGKGATVGVDGLCFDLSTLAMPGEGIEQFPDFEKAALHSELTAHER